MGCALPAAIGAAIASDKRVLCFVGDGAMMLNLSCLETIFQRKLPIKIFVFNNDGYAMIRGTQNTTLGGRYVAVNEATGVSCPSFVKVGSAFNIDSIYMSGQRLKEIPEQVWDEIKMMLDSPYPALCEVLLDPNQVYGPKLQPKRNADGTIANAVFSEMSP